jgi:AAA domain/Domain of unknown function (DUF3854)/Bacterial regulatory protein, arsR family
MPILAETPPTKLLPHHQALLDASAISAAVATARGYRSVTDPAELRSLGLATYQRRAGLLIPIWDVAGNNGTFQLRPDSPRVSDGKPVKYESPEGGRMVLDVPPSVRSKLRDPKVPLWITEGARKADSAVSAGLCCIAISGVFGWRGRGEDGGKTALADWESVALNDRSVLLTFDSDVTTKREVRLALGRLSGFLKSRGARVQYVVLPQGEDGAKVGLDDYFASGGTVGNLDALTTDTLPQPAEPEIRTAPDQGIFTAAALAGTVFPEPRWAVPSVIPEGATLLVGAPKKGKSWLLLGLGIAIAHGGVALGKIAVEQGDVLLLCLEDNPRRLQDRLWRILDGQPAPERLHLVTEWPRLDEGAADALDRWLTDHPETRLVGIDVLARLRPPSNGSGDLYARDYAVMAAIKAVADRHGVALVGVHHSRKASAGDPLDTISGTNGLSAAADTALILTREPGRADANLYVRGRDVPEADHALAFDPVPCRWNLLGDAAEYRLTAGRAEIVTLLRECGPLSPAEIADALQANRGTIRSLLHRMYNAGQVTERDGRYMTLSPPTTAATGATDGVTTPILPVAPPVPPATGATGTNNDLLQVLHPASDVQQAEIPITTPTVAGVAPVAGGTGIDPAVTQMVANLHQLTPDELAAYRREVAEADEGDIDIALDRRALALFDAGIGRMAS